MAKVTQRDKIIWHLTKNFKTPAREVQTRSKKYRVFQFPGTDGFYYVGKSGGLRTGSSHATSMSVGHQRVKIIVAKYDRAHAEST